MAWQSVLTLVVSGCMVIGFAALGIALHHARRRAAKAEAEAQRWRGKWREAVDEVLRMLSKARNRRLADVDADKKLRDIAASWSPNDPSGSGVGE